MKIQSLIQRLHFGFFSLGLFFLNCPSTASGDDGNIIGSATTLVPGTRSAFLTSGDVDWFRFTTSSSGLVAIYSQGLTNTRVQLYNAAGTYLNIADDDWGDGLNFSIIRLFEAGTYYAKVEPGFTGARTGSYSLTLRTQESSSLVSGTTFSGNLSAGQIDFVRIPFPTTGLFEVYTTGLTNTRAMIYNEVGTYLNKYDDDSGADYNFHYKQASFPVGTYLFVIQAGSIGAKTGAYDGFVLRPDLAEGIADGSYSRSLSPLGDVDHFTFTVPARGDVRIWTTGTTNTRAELYNEVGVYEKVSDDNSGSNYNFSLSRTLEPGKYYLRVGAGFVGSLSGAYQLNLDLPGGGEEAQLLRQYLLRKLAVAKKQFRKARSKSAKRKIRKEILILNRRIWAL